MEPIHFGWRVRRFERAWLRDALVDFAHNGLITDVLFPVRSGKEATVYACAAAPTLGVELVAAKVYHPPAFRRLARDGPYRVGRDLIDDTGKVVRANQHRSRTAVRKGTAYGKDLRRVSWLQHEISALQTLRALGQPVPEVFAQGTGAFLMTFVGDAHGAAPTLHTTRPDPLTARRVVAEVLELIDVAWSHDLVHADLSAYNILLWNDRPVVIDWPQAVHRWRNPMALTLLARDVERVCAWAQRSGVAIEPAAVLAELWPDEPDVEWYESR